MQTALYTYFTPKPKPEGKMAHPSHDQVAEENKVYYKQRLQYPAPPTI